MIRYANTVLDQYANAVSGVQITVLDADGGEATIFDEVGEVLLNPIATDAQGAYYFYAPEGTYTLQYRISPLGNPFRVVAAVLSASNQAANIDFLQAGTGAIARDAQDKMRDIVSVKDFGAVGDGATDDTVAIQNALDAMASGEHRLYFPKGIYCVSEELIAPAGVDCLEFVGGSGYDGTRGPINLGMSTALKWTGGVHGGAVIRFDHASGITWRGISINCNYDADYGLQIMSSLVDVGSIKNIIQDCSFHYAAKDGILIGEEGTPVAAPGERQFFGSVFRNITSYGCGQSLIHVNEWNADQLLFDSVMAYLDDAASPQDTLNAFWFDHGGQQSTLLNCQAGGMTVKPGIASSGFMIRNKAGDGTEGGAFGLIVIGAWQEGDGGLLYAVTSTNDQKSNVFIGCRSFTNDTGNRSVYIDKGTSDQIPYTFIGCSFLSDIEIASDTFAKQSLALVNCSFASGFGVIDYDGKKTVDGFYSQVGIVANQIVIPTFASVISVTVNATVSAVFAPGVSAKGDQLTVILTQDATGGRTVSWSGGNFSSLPPIPQPDPDAGAKTSYTFVSDGAVYYLASVSTIQSASISNPTGGSVIDVEARTAINSILAALRTDAMIAP